MMLLFQIIDQLLNINYQSQEWMKKNQLYRLCLKAGDFEDTPVFKVKVGKFEKTINTYFIPAQKQRYNYDLYFQRSKEPQIMIQVYTNQKLIGIGTLKFDANKQQMPNQTIQVLDNGNKIGNLEVSLKKLQKKTKKPAMKIKIIQASYIQNADLIGKMDPFVVVKYGDNNYKTNTCQQGGKTPVWKQQFNIGAGDNDRIFIQSWEQDPTKSQFIGVSIVDINSKLGKGQQDIDVTRDKTKQGVIKIQLLQHDSKRPDQSDKQINDKNFVKKRNIKTYAVQAVMKDNIKKGGFVKLQVGQNEYETTPIFAQTKELKWNQSFQIKGSPQEYLTAKLCLKQQIQEEIGRCSLKVGDIVNKKYQLSILDGEQAQIGKLYLQFFDQQLNIGQEIVSSPSKKQISEKKIQQKKPQPKISSQLEEKVKSNNEQIKKRYANRQSIHDYMADVNAVLQEGLLMIAKQRPEDPIKQLGLFLINYKK